MICVWKELVEILPLWLRRDVDELGKENMQELRLRLNAPPELVLNSGSMWLRRGVHEEDLQFVVNAASRYSPWASDSASEGYLTAPGGHRIGLCGVSVYTDGISLGFRKYTSLCIRVARDFTGIAENASEHIGSVLVLGAPGWGKTTYLRDLARQIAVRERVSVVDERNELFPEGFSRGRRMDVLSGCSKRLGVPMLLRTMGPECIAVDEITEEADTDVMIQAANCGVRLLATAHAASMDDYFSRQVYQKLIRAQIFDTYVILRKDKSYWTERAVR